MSELIDNVSWNDRHLYKVREQRLPQSVEAVNLEPEKLRPEIEPWLTALFQSEHLSLLLGAGISSAAHWIAQRRAGAGMEKIPFTAFQSQINSAINSSAVKSGRGTPNIEDQIRICNELIKGLEIYILSNVYGAKKIKKELAKFERELNDGLTSFANLVLE